MTVFCLRGAESRSGKVCMCVGGGEGGDGVRFTRVNHFAPVQLLDSL